MFCGRSFGVRTEPATGGQAMQGRQAAEVQSFKRALKFLDDHAGELNTHSLGPCRKRLAGHVKAIDDAAAGEIRSHSAQMGLTKAKHEIREDLRNTMGIVVSLAGHQDEMADLVSFTVPGIRTNDRALIAAARALASAAAPFVQVIERQLGPMDPVGKITANADELAACIEAHGIHRTAHRHFSAKIPVEIERARVQRNVLTATIRLETNRKKRPDLMVAWRAAISVHGKPGRKRTRGRKPKAG